MIISELIRHLEKVRDWHGDIDVEIPDSGCGCCGYDVSEIADIQVVSYGANSPCLYLTDRELNDHRLGREARVSSALTGADAEPREEWDL